MMWKVELELVLVLELVVPVWACINDLLGGYSRIGMDPPWVLMQRRPLGGKSTRPGFLRPLEKRPSRSERLQREDMEPLKRMTMTLPSWSLSALFPARVSRTGDPGLTSDIA